MGFESAYGILGMGMDCFHPNRLQTWTVVTNNVIDKINQDIRRNETEIGAF